jgi:rhodanese-related sulfurtransferase
MSLPHIDAKKAKQLIDSGAVLIDIREVNEHASENIPGAINQPLSTIAGRKLNDAPVLVFHCKSGGRTKLNAAGLAACTDADAYILDGGIEAWKAEGLPVKRG